MRAVGIASNEAEADTAVNVLGPDVVVIDMELGNGSAAALTTRMYEREPRVQVVALLGCYGVSAATRAIRAGANAVTTVTSPADHLVSAVVAAANGQGWVPPDLMGHVLTELRSSQPPPNEYQERLGRLTEREQEVLARMVAGCDRATIARDFAISVNTVRTHTQNILAKLGVHSGLEAVSVARRARDGSAHR
jgi:DNA-binding NarL/FixJ family response regulator